MAIDKDRIVVEERIEHLRRLLQAEVVRSDQLAGRLGLLQTLEEERAMMLGTTTAASVLARQTSGGPDDLVGGRVKVAVQDCGGTINGSLTRVGRTTNETWLEITASGQSMVIPWHSVIYIMTDTPQDARPQDWRPNTAVSAGSRPGKSTG